MRKDLLVIAGEVLLALVILTALLLVIFDWSSDHSTGIVIVGLIPFAIVQLWVLAILLRAFLRHPEQLRVRDNLRNYAFKSAAFLLFGAVGLNGIFHFMPRPLSSTVLVLGVYLVGIPGIVELARYYSSRDRRS